MRSSNDGKQPSRKFAVVMSASVAITVGDPSAITRCTENHDENGVPQPDERGSGGWRNSYYALTTERLVLEHWADNCLRNGFTDASDLDGWADLEPGVVTMRVEYTDQDWITESAR